MAYDPKFIYELSQGTPNPVDWLPFAADNTQAKKAGPKDIVYAANTSDGISLGADADNLNISNINFVFINNTSGHELYITGLTAPTDTNGNVKVIYLINNTSGVGDLVLVSNSSSSSAGNKFQFSAPSYTLVPGDGMSLIYDNTGWRAAIGSLSAAQPTTTSTTQEPTSSTSSTTEEPTSSTSSSTTLAPTQPIQTNLQSWWDARDGASYPGTGSTFYDLKLNNDLAFLTNGSSVPVWNPLGYMTNTESGYFSKSTTANLPSGDSPYTVQVMCRKSNPWNDASTYQLGSQSNKQGHSGFHRTSPTGLTQSTAFYDDSINANFDPGQYYDWVVMTYVYDGSNVSIYIEDTLAGTTSSTGGYSVTNSIFLLGYTQGFSGYEFVGDIMGACVYDIALNLGQIQTNMLYWHNGYIPTTTTSSSTTTSTTTFAPPILSNLFGWYDASDTGTTWQDASATTAAVANADPVDRWNDKEGGNNVLGDNTNMPTIAAAYKNGLNCLYFDGVADILENASISPNFGTNVTVSIVAKLVASGNVNNIWAYSASSGLYFLKFLPLQDTFITCIRTSGGPSACATGSYDTNWHVVTVTFDGTDEKTYIDGVLVGTETKAGTLTCDRIKFGNWYGDNHPFFGYIGELVSYNQCLSDADRGLLEAYLASKWAV